MKVEEYPIKIGNVMPHIAGWVVTFQFVTKCDRGGWVSKDTNVNVTYVNGSFIDEKICE